MKHTAAALFTVVFAIFLLSPMVYAAQGDNEDDIKREVSRFISKYPVHASIMGRQNVRKFVIECTNKTKSHEMAASREVNLIRRLMLIYGHEFDTDPMFPWARLKKFAPKDDAAPNPPSWQYLQTVDAERRRFWDKSTGTLYTNLLSAHRRAKALTFEQVQTMHTDDDIIASMRGMYPERFALIPEDALRGPVMQRAAQKAREFNLDPFIGKALFAGAIYCYGIGVDTDPQYRHAFDNLRGEAMPGLTKERALFLRLQILLDEARQKF